MIAGLQKAGAAITGLANQVKPAGLVYFAPGKVSRNDLRPDKGGGLV